MFDGKIGAAELLIILAIALIFFGPSKLSELGRGLGDAIRNLKGAMKDGEAAPSGESAPDRHNISSARWRRTIDCGAGAWSYAAAVERTAKNVQ